MKNILILASPRVTRGKLSISGGEGSEKKSRRKTSTSSIESDAFIDDLSIKLQSVNTDCCDKQYNSTTTSTTEIKEYPGFDKLIQDINSNNLSGYGKQSNLRRLKSWNKGFTKRLRELEENLPSKESLRQSIRQAINNNHNNTSSSSTSHKNSEDWKGIGFNVEDNWKGIGYSIDENKPVFEAPKSLPLRRRTATSDILRNKIIKQPLRRISSTTSALQRKLSDSGKSPISTTPTEEEPPTFIDFGACYSPDEMKSWGIVIEKLAATIRQTNNATHRRYTSISESIKEPAKKILSHSLPGSVKRRRKSYDLNRRSQSEDCPDCGTNDSCSSQEDVSDTSSPDLSLSREVMDEMFLNSFSDSFSANVWYHGEIDIMYICTVSNNTETEKDTTLTGSILARIDKYGEVVYSITYKMNDQLFIGSFPKQNGRYCLNFDDPEQPRFISTKYLIAYLIEKKFLERVTFSWLIDNCDQLLWD